MKAMKRLIAMARPWWPQLIIATIALLGITAMNLISPSLISDLIDMLAKPGSLTMQSLYWTAALLTMTYVVRAIFRFLNNYLSHKAAWELVPRLRVQLFDHLQHLALRYYQDKQTGQLMSRLISDADKIELLVAHAVPEMITNVVIFVSVTIILMFRSPTLTLMTFIPVPFFVVAGFFFTKRVRPLFRRSQETLGDLSAILQDNLSGVKEIQAFNQQTRERERVAQRSTSYSQQILKALKLSAIFNPTVEFFVSMGTVIVVLFGGALAMRGKLSPGDIVAFMLYLGMFYQPLSSMARLLEDITAASVSAQRVMEIFDVMTDVPEIPGAKPIPSPVRGEISFDHVDFGYLQDQPVLSDVSFVAEPGQMLAFVGPTGVGKTTIINLLERFYDPQKGCISIDGHDIRGVTLSSLREQISIVLQDVFLFHGSVAENIAYGCPDATMEQIQEAARIACAAPFIDELPDGYDTFVGERGLKLSGGQKQRLAIARAVLRGAPILVLDEATAAVDVETEAAIQEAIQNLTGHRTILVIAHRLSTVKKADCILVLNEGRIVERGTHAELLNKDGLYRRMCHVQLVAAQESAVDLLDESVQ